MPSTDDDRTPASGPSPESAWQSVVDEVAPLLVEAQPVIAAFAATGHRLYLVGGVVRDLLAGRTEEHDHDLDFTTDATPPEIKAIVGPVVDALWTQGERFGTIGAKVGDRTYEITTHRAETYQDDSRKPDVRFSGAIAEDLSRRDFTVNAMAIDVAERGLVDPYGGAADLADAVLRTPLDPETSFGDDPLRMLRAARFVAGYDLVPAADLVDAMATMGSRMAIVSVERIRDELDKLLLVPAAASGLELLSATGLLARLMPWAPPDTASAAVLIDRVRRVGPDPMHRLAVLVADPDPATVRRRLRELRYSSATVREVGAVVAGAVALVAGDASEAPGFRRWWMAVGPHAHAARVVAVALEPVSVAAVEANRRLSIELADELDHLGSPLSAHQVMHELGWPPGPRVGQAIEYLTELRLDHGPLDETAARGALRTWAEARDT